MAKKRGLGRGLDALLGIESGGSGVGEATSSDLSELPVDVIDAGRYQPRRLMSTEKLEELASSIRARGIVQPIVVRAGTTGRYELVAGERRWRAAKMAGLTSIPAVIKNLTDEEAMSIGLIENIQREQLSVIEEAQALDRLVREFELTHQEIAEAIGRSRAGVSNLIRLLDLSHEVRELVEAGKLEMGHARPLLGVAKELQPQIAVHIIEKGLSARQTEVLIKKMKAERAGQKKSKSTKKDPDVALLEVELSELFGSETVVNWNKRGKGSLVINFHSLDELDGIMKRIK